MENQQKYLVAISCITYNHEKYLADALEGFVMQKTNFPFVAIVHDDASTDGTADILRKYAEKYPDIIHPIYETENQYSKRDGSLGRIMNEAIAATGAKYIAMCEGDDYWTDQYKLQKQVDFMEKHEDVGLCYTDYNLCVENKIVVENIFHSNPSKLIHSFEEQLIKSAYIAPMSWLFRKDIYNQIAPRKSHTDGTFALSLDFFAKSTVAYLPETTAVYRSHIGSATTHVDPVKHWYYEKGVFETQLEYAEKYHCTPELIQNLKLQGYVDFLLPALEANDEDFVQEVINYYSSQGMELGFFVDKCKRYVRYHQQYEMIRKSKAYKLGKILLKPLKWLKR